ncbi:MULTISPECIES: PAS domain-containing protein [Pseudomonas]|uniref:histidine kinase n=1 Tax=Pseudomonas fulva TaxID=47880 RepID=A0A0D0KB13_9PSED|nr:MULTISPECIES: PAS domain-containing protein [Pseudomonas]KIQ06072.1 chemotaxis protein CheY [Pseudomonas fulva]
MDQLTKTAPRDSAIERFDFLASGGKIGELLQSGNGMNSPLGSPAQWSPSLKTLMATVLPVKAQIALLWGPDYIALYNDAYAPTIGDKHPRALGRPAVESWTELWDDLEPLLHGVRETGETFAAKDRPFYIERHGRGETVYFDVSYSAVREADGSVGGVLCIVSETTERVQFERRQTFLLELGQALPSINDPDSVEALVLRRLTDELKASRVSFAQNQGDGTTFAVKQRYPTQHDGASGGEHYEASEIDLLRSGQPLLRPGDENQQAALHVPVVLHHALEAVLVIEHEYGHGCTDHEAQLAEETAKLAWAWITRAQAEAALRASSAQLSAMFDQASAGIAVCDDAWALVRVNDRYCEIVGRSREELLGQGLYDLGQPGETSRVASACERSLRRGQQFESTRPHNRPDGTTVWTQNHITPLLDEQRHVTGTICVCVDISERMRAEAELRALNEGLEDHVADMVAQREAAIAQLHEAHKMELVGQLTGGFAHDFNNLLTPIMASLELIRRRVPDERASKLVDGALQAADRARILVERLLTFARRQTLKPQAVSLATVIGEMRDLIQRSLGPTTEVCIDIPAEMPTVFIDPHQLELAILNLTVNARDAMLDGGRLKITAELDALADGTVESLSAGQYVHLRVEDSGSGMDEETLRRCIEPFYSTKDVGKGTGLGLPMVQGLLVQSGGGFDIVSQVGQGTRVSLWLPIADTPATRDTSSTEEDAPRAPRPTHVLLVDDENLVRDTTSLHLHDLGYEVTETCSAAAALKLIEGGLKPDVLVTDHVMANKTGAQLAQELRQSMPDLPVLIITGYASLTPTQISDFEVLAKPFRRRDIAIRLAQLVNAKGASPPD